MNDRKIMLNKKAIVHENKECIFTVKYSRFADQKPCKEHPVAAIELRLSLAPEKSMVVIQWPYCLEHQEIAVDLANKLFRVKPQILIYEKEEE